MTSDRHPTPAEETGTPDTDWWDPRNVNSFFSTVYRRGNSSTQGHLRDRTLTEDERTLHECTLVSRLIPLRRDSRILDCPCGYGRHAVWFARQGCHVTGVDLAAQFIEEAQDSAHTLGLSERVDFRLGDMRDLSPLTSNSYDCCLNMFYSFGFFSDPDNLSTLSAFYRVLKPGGYLLIHTDVNPEEIYSNQYWDRTERLLTDGATLRIHEEFDPIKQRINGRWKIENRDGITQDNTYSMRIYQHQELEALAMECGFSSFLVHREPPLFRDETQPQEFVYVFRK